jgi:proline iminopeptidase
VQRDPLYPPIEPYRSGTLAVDGQHTLYWEECGNPSGVPVVFLHGGPGAGCAPIHRRFFDPSHYRVVLFDQRGAGRSRPLASVEANSPDILVADIERLRRHLGIEAWHVFGGSWGSTLALLYAQAHPAHCRGLILRGIFLMRRREIDWFLYGMRRFFPEAWRSLVEPIPEAERDDLLEAYYARLMDPDAEVHLPAARRWAGYEAACSTLLPNPRAASASGDGRHALALSRIETHFFRNHLVIPEERILEAMDAIAQHPAIIVQGRYDVVCPPATALELKDHWPGAELAIIDDAGHSALEPGIRTALVKATNAMKRH